MDPDEPVRRAKTPAPANLEIMGIAEIEAYIADLEAEIERARSAIAAKRLQKAAAEKLFGA